jgi:hypothetical protein
MHIISSIIAEDSIQEDGRRYIRELHISESGEELQVMYLANHDTDAEEVLALRAAQLEGESVTFPPE